MAPTRVLIASQDRIGPAMAGPAIRSVELARVLAHEHSVTIMTSVEPDALQLDVDVVRFSTERQLLRCVREADVLITFGSFLSRHPGVTRTDTAIVADLYDPALLESLVLHKTDPMDWQLRFHRGAMQDLRLQLERADSLICASERQRHYVLGMLTAAGRINPATFRVDPTLRGLVRTVPFGLPAPPTPIRRPGPLRSKLGLASDDVLVLWGGGIYDWLDPISIIEALAGIGDDRLKLFFMGTTHPTPAVPTMQVAQVALDRSRELGLLGRSVFFGDGWIPYADRSQYLLDADIGVSLHHDHVETTFAFRTRILDYLWAGLPIVCSAGDACAELVEQRHLGEVVPIGDPGALRAALLRLVEPRQRADALRPAPRGGRGVPVG